MIDAPVIEAVDVNHFYEGQLGWSHALDHLSLTCDLRKELARPRDRHTTALLAVKSRIMEEMRHHGVTTE